MVKAPWQILKAKLGNKLHACIVEAGEILFVPRGWWHSTWNLDDQIAVAPAAIFSPNLGKKPWPEM